MPQAEVFLGDEAGFGGDPRLRGYFGGHVRQNVVGPVNPATGQLVSLTVPHCDSEVFQAYSQQ